MTTRRWPPTSH